MRSATLFSVCAGIIFFSSPARAISTLHLNWNDCSAGASASTLKTFLCADDTSTFVLIESVTTEGITSPITGMECYVDFLAAGGGPISDWWQMQTGGCRDGSLFVAPRVVPQKACENFWPALVSGGFQFTDPCQ